MNRTVVLPTGVLRIQVHREEMSLDSLTGFAARNNPKRGFLFVSRVLGKHLPVRPSQMRETHLALARKMLSSRVPALTGPLLAVGMAETATALGQGVFDAFTDRWPGAALYLNTTRYRLEELSCLTFDESHSHASTHFLHVPEDEKLRQIMHTARTLVLLDDEISTGNTFVGLAKSVATVNRHLERVVIVTLLNWLTPEAREVLSRRFSCPVDFVSLLDGAFSFTSDPAWTFTAPARSEVLATPRDQQLRLASGRRGSGTGWRPALDDVWAQIEPDLPPPGGKILILGTGEFMYSPYQLALRLEEAGYAVWFQASTRSPILLGNAIEHVLAFEDNYGEGIDNFLYNTRPEHYDQIFACYETPTLPDGHTLPQQTNARVLLFTE